MDYGRAITNTLTLWFKDGKMLKLVGLKLLVGLVFLLLFGGAIWFFFEGLVPQIMALSSGGTPSPEAIVQLLGAFLAALVPFLIIIAPLLLLEMAISIYISVLMQTRALEVLGFNAPQVTPMRVLKYIFMNIWVSIMTLTSWYSRKLFYVFLGIIFVLLFGGVLAFIVPPIGAIFLVLGILALIPYMFVCIYNSIRLSIADAVFLSSEDGVLASVRKTWGITAGKALDVFLALILLGICLIVVSFGLSIPEMFIRSALTLLTGSIMAAIVFGSLYRVALNPIIIAMASFISPAIYLELTSLAPAQSAPPLASVQPAPKSVAPFSAGAPALAKPAKRKSAARKK